MAIIGQSRGGVFARALAARRPDLVSGIVTLGSPTVSQLSVHPFVLAQVALVGALGTRAHAGDVHLALPARRVLPALPRRHRRRVPARGGLPRAYSKTDGVVDWRACLDPAAECVEVRASHMGMGLNAQV